MAKNNFILKLYEFLKIMQEWRDNANYIDEDFCTYVVGALQYFVQTVLGAKYTSPEVTDKEAIVYVPINEKEELELTLKLAPATENVQLIITLKK